MQKIENTIREYFHCKEGIIAVYLYGSIVSGHTHPESDVDIAVLYEHAHIPSIFQLFELMETLSELINKKVDLVCLNSVSPILQKQVIFKGKPLMVNDSHQLALFVIKAYNMYIDLKMIRRPIEESVLKRLVING